MKNDHSIILFDGICNLCNGSVNFILKRDRKKLFQFVAMQSDKGKDIIKKYRIPGEIDSVILLRKGRIYLESEAAIEISRHLSFPWNGLILFKVIPQNWRDAFYRWIAKNRYKWFGKRNSCRVI